MGLFVMLVGLPAYGKSFVRYQLTKNFGFFISNPPKIISTDDIIEKIGKQFFLTYTESFKDLISFSEKVSWNEFQEAFKNHKNIIVDRTNLSASSRRKYLNVIRGASIPYRKVCLVLEQPPYEELNRRLEERKMFEGKEIPPEVMVSMLDRLEIPKKEEGFDAIFSIPYGRNFNYADILGENIKL